MPEKALQLDAFGIPVREEIPVELNEDYMIKPKVVLDKVTGGTKIDLSDKVNITEMIQSYRDQVGIEAIMRMIAKGQLNPEAVKDDGKHGLDISHLPDNVNEARDAAIAAEASKKQIAKVFGVDPKDLTADTFEAIIQKAVDQKLAEAKQKEVKKDAE